MHDAVRLWVSVNLPTEYSTVVEFGSRDINGGIRDLLDPAASYLGVDVNDGPGVDVVADAAEWDADEPVDLIVCAEVFEHCATWPELVGSALRNLRDGGTFIATMAGPGRAPHSAHSEGRMRPDEYYSNVTPDALRAALGGFSGVVVDQAGLDVRCKAVK